MTGAPHTVGVLTLGAEINAIAVDVPPSSGEATTAFRGSIRGEIATPQMLC